jgi:hypothetical protein
MGIQVNVFIGNSYSLLHARQFIMPTLPYRR